MKRPSARVSEEPERMALPRILLPCLPVPVLVPPSGTGWIHEIKHDGFRIIAVRNGGRVRLLTRKGIDLAMRFPLGGGSDSAARPVLCDRRRGRSVRRERPRLV